MIETPLIVDLDGTLIHTDMLHESALRVLRDKPFDTLRIPFWLAAGKAVLKQRLADRTEFDPVLLPYNLEFLGWLKLQRATGRTLILCTASDLAIAEAIAAHLDVFDEVMASDGTINLAGKNKADALELRFGKAGFDYAGNASADLAFWQRARAPSSSMVSPVWPSAPPKLAKSSASFLRRHLVSPPGAGCCGYISG